MASVYSCIKGKFGPWEYYHITMPAADVATKLMIPKDMPGWEDLTLEEKFQRKLNKNRVNNQIVKYLTDNKFRFFGSLLVTVKNHTKMEFSEVKGFVNKDLAHYIKMQVRIWDFFISPEKKCLYQSMDNTDMQQ